MWKSVDLIYLFCQRKILLVFCNKLYSKSERPDVYKSRRFTTEIFRVEL